MKGQTYKYGVTLVHVTYPPTYHPWKPREYIVHNYILDTLSKLSYITDPAVKDECLLKFTSLTRSNKKFGISRTEKLLPDNPTELVRFFSVAD